MMTKYQSLTTPEIKHDVANILVEFVWLNTDLAAKPFPWRGDNGKQWSKLVAAVKKLMGAPYHLTAEQIAFYIFKCNPRNINPFEFAKMAVVARKLFRKYDIEELHRLYSDRRQTLQTPGLEKVAYKIEKPKSFLMLLRELERGET